MTKLSRFKATALLLSGLEQPVITNYQLGVLVHRLYLSKKHMGQNVNISKDFATQVELQNIIRHLVDEGILNSHKNFSSSSVYSILGKSGFSADEVACSVDPFAYVSHLSAMDYHGLTDRMTKTLFLSSPAQSKWKEFAVSQMKKDCGDSYDKYIDHEMPHLQRITMNKIDKRDIHRYSSIHLGAYTRVKGSVLRVSSIGRTFLDMLKEPSLCGGMYHVLQVFDKHAQNYLKLIVDEIEKNGAPIDKVRAGYVLNERLEIKNDIVDGWKQFAQRGGSRKLDPSGDYAPVFSEAWCLSLNFVDL